MKAKLLCGKETLTLEFPDSVRFIENRPAPALADPDAAV